MWRPGGVGRIVVTVGRTVASRVSALHPSILRNQKEYYRLTI